MTSKTTSSKIPVMVCVDIEPNEWYPKKSQAEDWSGYERAHAYFQELRPSLSRATSSPARYNWYFRMDPQIEKIYGSTDWTAKNFKTQIDLYRKEGDLLGLHAHAYRWEPSRDGWIVDHGDQKWIEHCLRVSFEAFERSFGEKCDSFRFGSRWMNNETMALLETLGTRFEMTVEPGYTEEKQNTDGENFTGSIPSHLGAPHYPYHPLRNNFLREDRSKKEGLWVIPTSTGAGRHPRSWKGKLLWRLTHPFSEDTVFLRLDTALDPYFFKQLLDQLLSRPSGRYLTVIQRTDIFMKPALFKNAQENFRILLNHPLCRHYVFTGPAELIRLLGCS